MGTQTRYVVALDEVGERDRALVGGKAANLGELMHIPGTGVPPGFCVTTAAFADAATHGDAIAAQVTAAYERLGDGTRCAVRSSATAEDLPTASFAGQHDSFLDVTGASAVLEHVRRCWASLGADRAASYRAHHDATDDAAAMGVVVQQLVAAEAAGVLFTADPVTGHRRTTVVEAVRGLGDELVAGRAVPQTSTVRDGVVVGTTGEDRVLTDEQLLHLERLGRRIEAHFGAPQDIEWCLAGDDIALVQSRPITTLYPIPQVGDEDPHVYVSVGHQQMMTDAMRPLGLSLWQMIAFPVMHEAAGRLFVDVADRLASAATRDVTVRTLGEHDPLVGGALQTLLERPGFLPSLPEAALPPAPPRGARGGAGNPTDLAPEIVEELMGRSDAAVADIERTLRDRSGPAVFAAIRADVQELKGQLFHPDSHRVIMVAMEAARWLDEHLERWLGEMHGADVLSQSVVGNVTSEMGLALLDVADVVRPHAEVVAHLERAGDDELLAGLVELPGGREVQAALLAFLDRYGMRCAGEIDLTRPRWSERPTTLVPVLLGHVRHAEPGAGSRRFERGRLDALVREEELLERLRLLPDGQAKADAAKQRIDLVRAFSGYREFPKYGIVRRLSVYKRALLREADRLVEDGVLSAPEDCFFLRYDEFEEVARTGRSDARLLAERRRAFAAAERLTPPRVLTSDGEVLSGAYPREGVPDGALVGLAVSAGTVEGRARVVHDLAAADLEPGDVLVTRFTDPSWTPLFLAVAGLVTEVGGQMTHGSVIAREYGLPAVVGVPDATRLIRDGARIRVHGTDGFVELLD